MGRLKHNYQTEYTVLTMALSTQALPEQLDALEARLTQLLGVMENMATENQALREREQALQNECASLQRKNAVASVQIETIIGRLKNQTADKEA